MPAKFLKVTNVVVVVSKLVNFIAKGGKNHCQCKHFFSDKVSWLFNNTFSVETIYLVAWNLSTEIFSTIGKFVVGRVVI